MKEITRDIGDREIKLNSLMAGQHGLNGSNGRDCMISRPSHFNDKSIAERS